MSSILVYHLPTGFISTSTIKSTKMDAESGRNGWPITFTKYIATLDIRRNKFTLPVIMICTQIFAEIHRHHRPLAPA